MIRLLIPIWDYSGPMAELHVRNLPPELHERLREQALDEGRSMSSEAIVLLRQALTNSDDRPARQRSAIDRLRELQRNHRLPADAPLAEELVREDRDAVG